MQEVVSALLEFAKGVALSMTVVTAGSLTIKLLSILLKEVEKRG